MYTDCCCEVSATLQLLNVCLLRQFNSMDSYVFDTQMTIKAHEPLF